MITLAYTFLIFVALVLTRRVFNLWRQKRAFRYPPGPPGNAITGNFFDLPQKKPWLVYTEWAKQYGDIIHLEALGDHVIILSSLETVNDLLEKRSRIYSSRPHPEVAELSGWGFNITLQGYNDTWRKNRKTYQQHLRPDAVAELRPIMQGCIAIFLDNLLHTPDNFMGHIDLLSCSLALSPMYGVKVDSAQDPLLRLAKVTTHTLDTVFSTRYNFLVSSFPSVRFIPEWVPVLGNIARFISNTKKLCRDLRELPFNQVLKDMESGRDNDGLVARVLKRDSIPPEEFGRIKDMATTILVATADTTLSSLGTFFLAMAHNPQCQERAWREINSVIGSKRLPTYEDRKSLPYIGAIYREVMRWHPPGPIVVAHSSTEDDNYKGYDIPRGSTMIANVWAMTHDERVYDDPYQFKPERFFDANGKLNDDDTILAFGFGRRICVGKHFADVTMWLTIASVLTCFKISRPEDATENESDIEESYSDGPGVFCYPLPFRCSISPRHPEIRSLFA